jgi:hypothetical protein
MKADYILEDEPSSWQPVTTQNNEHFLSNSSIHVTVT